MNGYETILSIIKQNTNTGNNMQIGIMNNQHSCSIGNLVLNKEDLKISEHLLTGYHKAIDSELPSLQNDNTFIKPLSKGDMVLICKINNELYAVIERLV